MVFETLELKPKHVQYFKNHCDSVLVEDLQDTPELGRSISCRCTSPASVVNVNDISFKISYFFILSENYKFLFVHIQKCV